MAETKIYTLKDWKKNKFKQHPLFYLFLFFFVFDFYMLSMLSTMEHVYEGYIEDWNGSTGYYVEKEEAETNRNFLLKLNKFIIPMYISSQILILLFISIKLNQHIKNKNFHFSKGIIRLLWVSLSIGGYFCFVFFIPSEIEYAQLISIIALLPFLIGQFQLYKFWEEYMMVKYHIECIHCSCKIDVDSRWFNNKKNETIETKINCNKCKSGIELQGETKVFQNYDYVFINNNSRNKV